MAQNIELRPQSSVPTSPSVGVVKIYVDNNGSLNTIDSNGSGYAFGRPAFAQVQMVPQNITVGRLNIPVLQSGVSTDISVPHGNLLYSGAVLVGFFVSGADTSSISGMRLFPGHFASGVRLGSHAGVSNSASWSPISIVAAKPDYYLYISEDYTKSRRFVTSEPGGFNEAYGQNGDLSPSPHFSYSDNGSNTLVGYYATQTKGVFNIDKKVQLNSAWLDGSGNAVFSLTNWDATNTAIGLQVGFYE